MCLLMWSLNVKQMWRSRGNVVQRHTNNQAMMQSRTILLSLILTAISVKTMSKDVIIEQSLMHKLHLTVHSFEWVYIQQTSLLWGENLHSSQSHTYRRYLASQRAKCSPSMMLATFLSLRCDNSVVCIVIHQMFSTLTNVLQMTVTWIWKNEVKKS